MWRALHLDGGSVECPVYARDDLRVGQEIFGPAIIEQSDTTCFIDKGFRARVDEHLNIRIQAEQ
jgi:N-methylhydantoinase A/oxoprolinase/acetone carboxylase beta subunit